MDAPRWERIETLFFAALEQEAAERAAFLEAECAGDDALRREVEEMLGAQEQSHALLLENRLLSGEAIDTPEAEALVDTRIGPYRLTALIGRGGMGEVYLAERDDDQYRKQVALKLIRPGYRTAEIVLRFRMERQILARLVHPHIAQLLDGGMTEDGRPYLVMQYIEGLPINEYCNVNRLSIEDRLQLFRTVCIAVQFAHRNLVVHRDLKPSNILVKADGTVKLLDFGIAKLLDPETAGLTVAQTRSEIRVMTPEYASPEQVRGEAVTTAADVYALGVLLYELLTGHRPYRLAGRLQAEIERIICEEEPTRPSTAITTTEEVRRGDGTSETLSPEAVGAARRTPVSRLQRQLRGDLDNMVMMALRKEPERRYASAEQMGEDIGRYLDGRPVLAQKDTPGYRVRKFIYRNRMGVGVATAFVVLLIGFSGMLLVQSRTVARERDVARAEQAKAEQVVQVLVNLFETSNPFVVPGGDTLQVGDFLDRGADQVLEELQDQPEVRTRMKEVLAALYQARSAYEAARTLLEEALAERRALGGPDDPDAARIFHKLAVLYGTLGERNKAETMLRASLEWHVHVYGRRHQDVAQCLHDLARVVTDEAEQRRLVQEAFDIRKALLSANHAGIAASLNAQGTQHLNRNELEEAARLYREALEMVQELYGEDHPHAQTVMNNLATAYVRMGDYDTSERLHRHLLALRRKMFGNQTEQVALTLNNLGTLFAERGDYPEGETAFREALSIWTELFGPEHTQTANTARNLGLILGLQQRPDDALPYLDQALETTRSLKGPESRAFGYFRAQRAVLLMRLGRIVEAEAEARAAVEVLQQQVPSEGHYTLAGGQAGLGTILLEVNQPENAEVLFRSALAFQERTLQPKAPSIARVRCGLGRALAEQGRFAEAAPLLQQGYPVFEAWGLADHDDVVTCRRSLGETMRRLKVEG